MPNYNSEWVIEQLNDFICLTNGKRRGSPEEMGVYWCPNCSTEDILFQYSIVERIFDLLQPNWNIPPLSYQWIESDKNPWEDYRNLAIKLCARVRRAQEIEENIGSTAPSIQADQLHPWVWEGAKALWESGHFRSAVEDAAKKVNAETQNKVNRRDIAEKDLFIQCFSEDEPSLGRPRLRRTKDDGSDTYKSMQRGARTLAEGIFAGIRNPFNHEAPQDIDMQTALEYLATLSVLARWVDESEVVTAG